jgi:predicted Zn finger-like uncharacterized protein
MLIVCPSCATSYSLTEEQLGRGRTLRCAQCRHTWFASPDQPAEAAAAPASMPEAGPDGAQVSAKETAGAGKPAPAPKRRRTPRMSPIAALRKVPAWQAALAALLVGLGLAVVQRKAVVAAVPQTARLFAAIGLPVNLRGLAFSEVRSQVRAEQDQTVLVVEGEIRNVAGAERSMPAVLVSLRNADGREIYAWTSEAPRAALAAGETAPFQTRLIAPPLDGRDVLVRFARDETRAPAAN